MDWYLSLSTKVRVYQTCETCRLLVADIKRLEAFHMKCQRHVAKIRWRDHVQNTEVSSLADLGPVLDPIVRRRGSLFGHVARLPEDTPAHQALPCHIDLSLGRLPDPSWGRCPPSPRNRWLYHGVLDNIAHVFKTPWLDKHRRDNSTPPADLWRRAVSRGHSGVTLRSSTTAR